MELADWPTTTSPVLRCLGGWRIDSRVGRPNRDVRGIASQDPGTRILRPDGVVGGTQREYRFCVPREKCSESPYLYPWLSVGSSPATTRNDGVTGSIPVTSST